MPARAGSRAAARPDDAAEVGRGVSCRTASIGLLRSSYEELSTTEVLLSDRRLRPAKVGVVSDEARAVQLEGV